MDSWQEQPSESGAGLSGFITGPRHYWALEVSCSTLRDDRESLNLF